MNLMPVRTQLSALFACLCISGPLIGAAFGADAELTNYKTGIDVTFSGTRGTDYAEEYLYYDKLISDRKIIYIKSTTQISMAHNARNVLSGQDAKSNIVIGVNGQDGVPNSGDEGVIRYRVDRDMQWGPRWGDGSASAVPATWNNPAYTSPFTFASLNYAPDASATPVVGTTGAVPSVNVADYTHYYWRGISDAYGDEWHIISVADDDSFYTSASAEQRASDGKMLIFVVNPKTPCLTLRTDQVLHPDAQFYTTPAKVYFIPKINAQTTYLTDNVDIQISDINGNNVHYRINTGAWTDATSSSVTLSSNALPSGTSTLEYYYDGGIHKVRMLVKNPSYPSANETHGNLMWKDATGYAAVLKRIAREPYKTYYNGYLTLPFYNPQTAFLAAAHQGLRIRFDGASVNAFCARTAGFTAKMAGQTKSYADVAKAMLLESPATIDSVGFEINHSGQYIPTRELFERGYYDVNAAFDMAFAYDLLIANFKSTQQTGGITAVEDYFIRDQMASFAFQAMMQLGHWSQKEYPNPGMWGTARDIGGLVVAMAMPSYSTSYYGTSGFDGNTTTYPYTPFPDTPLTWKAAMLDGTAAMPGYPNLEFRLGAEEYMVDSTGQFTDRVDYFGFPLMGHCFTTLANMTKMYTSVTYPHLEAAFGHATDGTLVGTKDLTEGTRRMACLTVLNRKFPTPTANALSWMLHLPLTDPNKQDLADSLKTASVAGPTVFAWFEDDQIVPDAPTNLLRGP